MSLINDVFHSLPLEEQRRVLSARLTEATLPELMQLCARLADTSPLMFLMRTALSRGYRLDSELGSLLLTLPTTSLQKVLELDGLEEAVGAAWRTAEVGHLVSFALLDRYLRRRAPDCRSRLQKGVSHEGERLLSSGERLTEREILRLSGKEQKRLGALYPEPWRRTKSDWKSHAEEAIHHLAARPRDVSLANAERLLSQQVYTEQGHFLLELLQNADDAGADEFEVHFRDRLITVSHNGDPFDFRDLVGVLSIGQTTKTERQIGYFGVGFKSVFEVTERPWIESGFFSFEIVEISVPRSIRSSDNETGLTTLHLPLKPELLVDPFYARALTIPETLLLNLPNLRLLRWIGPDGRTTELSRRRDGDIHFLKKGESVKSFLVWKGRYHHHGARPEGKPQGAELTLAFPLNQTELDQNLFSFLPVQEDSGLRFLIGSHFDVPVDRERLDQQSTWNQGLIDMIPGLVEELCREKPDYALSILPLLPLPGDPVGPLFSLLSPHLIDRLKRVGIVSASDGSWRPASSVEVLEEDLAPLFTSEERARFQQPADERTRRWLVELGASVYDLKQFLLDLAGGVIPDALSQPGREVWSRFHRLILQSPSFDVWQQKLRQVPLFLDSRGRLSNAQQFYLMPPEWPAIFRTPPRTLHPELLEVSETDTLMASLKVRELRLDDLIGLLKRYELERFHLESLLALMLEAPRSIQLELLRLPLFSDGRGARGVLASPGRLAPGLLVAVEDAPRELFSDLAFCAESEILRPLLQACDWPLFGPALALIYLVETGRLLEPEQAEAFRQWLLRAPASVLNVDDLHRLAGLPLFESSRGTLRTLDKLWTSKEPGLPEYLDGVEFLCQESSSAQLVARFELNHRLREARLDTVLERMGEDEDGRLLRMFSARADELSRRQVVTLLRKPIVQGRAVAFSGNPDRDAVTVAETDFVGLFEALGSPVADLEHTRLLLPLMQAAGFIPAGLPELMRILRGHKGEPPPDCLPRLHSVLLSHREEILVSYSERDRTSIPVWLCRDGRVRSSRRIPPNEEVAELLGLSDHRPLGDSSVELVALFPLSAPRDFLEEFLEEKARPGFPLTAQPEGLNDLEKVDRIAERLPNRSLAVNALEQLSVEPLFWVPAEAHRWLVSATTKRAILHLDSSDFQRNRAQPFPLLDLLYHYRLQLDSPACRSVFYEYLSRHLSSILNDEQASRYLLEEPIWPTSGGGWRALNEMVLEAELADLGEGWYPSEEIPSTLLEQLKAAFQIGRPDPATLLRSLLEHYFEALDESGDASRVLNLLSRVGTSLTGWEVQQIYQETMDRPFVLVVDGRRRLLCECYAPPPGLHGLRAAPPFVEMEPGFLRKLGLPYLPAVDELRRVGQLCEEDAEALLLMVEWVWEERRDDLVDHLEFLSRFVWLRDREGGFKAPVQLYQANGEVEELVGHFPDLFPVRPLSISLARALGLRDENSVELSQVLRFLRRQVETRQRLGSRFYSYLNQTLENGVVDASFLRRSLGTLAWVYTDEGEFRPPNEVLGFPAFRYFGPFRGTWERAASRFPTLTRLFDIPEKLTVEAVSKFLEEVSKGSHAECPPRLLINCLVFLSERGSALPAEWRVIPALRFPDLELELVAAAQLGVMRSNSPTLASLFGQGGTLWVVENDDPEQSEPLEELYQRIGIPRLQDAYTVKPDASGTDVTARVGDQVSKFRGLIKAIDSVLPRLRAARAEWSEGEWLAETQLRPFAVAAPIRVIEGLRLFYDLPKVSRVSVTASLAYDPEGAQLYVSASALAEPRRYAVELAEGLAECIYQGPGSDSLVDLLNLLLLYTDADQMNLYLDLRHFPRPFQEALSGMEPWRERLGEILDHGLHHTLGRLYPETDGADWQRWREVDWQPSSAVPEEWLEQIGVSAPSESLCSTLREMVESEDLRLPSVETAAVAEQQSFDTVAAVVPSAKTEKESAFSNFRRKLVNKLSELVGSPSTTFAGISPRPGGESSDLSDSYKHPPERHILFSDRGLSGSHLYCLDELCSNFDFKSQCYVSGVEQWNPIFVPSGRTVQFSGAPTLADRPLPLPLYSKLLDYAVESGETTLTGPDALGRYRFSSKANVVSLRYTVELSEVPNYRDFDRVPECDPRLLATTVTLPKLPADLRKWIDWARGSNLPHWQLVDRATELIRASYHFDTGFAQLEAVKAVASQPLKPGENRFLEMLHAGAGARYLGRGVCSELSAVLLEVLRHCGVPSALARVWMLDEGLVHVPDHVVVMAWLPSEYGAFWLPFDPSGERMDFTRKASEEILTRLELLEQAAELLLPGLEGLPTLADRKQRFLQDRLLGVLGHSDLLELFLECLTRPDWLVDQLGPELEELYSRGFLDVRETTMYRVGVRGLMPRLHEKTIQSY